jgi:hypothetical protein
LSCALACVVLVARPAAAEPAGVAPSATRDAASTADADPSPDPAPEPDPDPNPAPEPNPPPDPSPTAEPAPEPAGEPAPDDAAYTAEKAARSSWVTQQRTAVLRRQLAIARQQERDATSWIPWALAGTGVVAVATGAIAGTIGTLSCDRCGQPAWSSWVLMGGAAFASVGTLWITLQHEDRAELRYRRERIEQQLEYERWNAQPRARGAALSISGRL